MSPDLRLRLHATQAQPCFPAASNALALPGGNGIFTATPAERITHYTLLRKVVCQMGALPPLETPTRKGGTLPLHGAHTAFSCYPALRLYRLSKSPRGIDVVSLTLGNSVFPLGYRPVRHMQPVPQLLLGHPLFPAALRDKSSRLFCVDHSASPPSPFPGTSSPVSLLRSLFSRFPASFPGTGGQRDNTVAPCTPPLPAL